jgi:hypothetical protein
MDGDRDDIPARALGAMQDIRAVARSRPSPCVAIAAPGIDAAFITHHFPGELSR